MNILEINKFFYVRGGVEVVFFETIRGLRERGHRVAEFSMHSPSNLPSDYTPYFASEIPELLDKQSFGSKLTTFFRFLYSFEIQDKLTRLVATEKPDIAHIHGAYHHLSASTFTTLRKLKIPTVVTLHDFFPLSPSRNFVIGNTLNEAAYKKSFACTRARCVDNQLLPSLAGDLEAYYYRLRQIWQHVDLFICPSQFMADTMAAWGFPPKKLRVILNPFRPPEQVPELPLGTKILFLGRIHPEKGIRLLLEAARAAPELSFLIVGSGPDEKWVDAFIKKNNLTNVERRGSVAHGSPKYFSAIREAKVMVTPSLFYENCSLTILETLYYRRIAVGVQRGGIPEMIKDGVTGFLAKPENVQDLNRTLHLAMGTTAETAERITAAGKKLVAERYDANTYLTKLETLLHDVANKR